MTDNPSLGSVLEARAIGARAVFLGAEARGSGVWG